MYNSPWVQAENFGPCLHTGMMTWSKITGAAGKAGVELGCSIATAVSCTCTAHNSCAQASSAAGTGHQPGIPTIPGHSSANTATAPGPRVFNPSSSTLQWRSAEQTWPKPTATAKFLTQHGKRGLITVFPNPLRISDSYCSSYYSVLFRDDYSLYLNAWMKMKAKLAPAINQEAFFKWKQMQLTEKLVRCQFSWHLQVQFWVTPLYGYAKASWAWSSVLPTKSRLYSKHDKLLQYLWCKGSIFREDPWSLEKDTQAAYYCLSEHQWKLPKIKKKRLNQYWNAHQNIWTTSQTAT